VVGAEHPTIAKKRTFNFKLSTCDISWRRCGLIARRTDNGATVHQTAIRIARDRLANESLIQRKPNNGSARLSWARENSKHRRTATRQQGF